MDIGTAKPTPEERAAAPHHLIDILDPDEDFSLAGYVALARAAIDEIHARGRVPILAGGTPLYVNAVVEGWRMPQVPPDPALRAALEAEAARDGLAPLEARLAAVDPVAAARTAGNLRRIIRALEVYQHTGLPMSAQEGKEPPALPDPASRPRPGPPGTPRADRRAGRADDRRRARRRGPGAARPGLQPRPARHDRHRLRRDHRLPARPERRCPRPSTGSRPTPTATSATRRPGCAATAPPSASTWRRNAGWQDAPPSPRAAFLAMGRDRGADDAVGWPRHPPN